MRTACLLFSPIAILTLFVAPAFGRLIENWPYDRLFKEADLVVIAIAESTAVTKDRFRFQGLKVEFIGQDTKFVVRSTLKGKAVAEKKLTVLHFRLPKRVEILSGPLLVTFRSKGVSLKGTINGMAFKAGLARPDYMLFLRTRPDGRYELVSGQFDPALSVRELQPADNFIWSFGEK